MVRTVVLKETVLIRRPWRRMVMLGFVVVAALFLGSALLIHEPKASDDGQRLPFGAFAVCSWSGDPEILPRCDQDSSFP